jgi:hypothetical protein
MALYIHGETVTAREVWIGMADNVLAFQVGNRPATASTNGIKSAFLRANTKSGTPRYLHGKCMTCTATTCSSEQRIGVI